MVRVKYARTHNGGFAPKVHGLGGADYENAYPPPSTVAGTPFADAPALPEAPDLKGARSTSVGWLVGWRQTLYVTLGRAVLETWNDRNNDYRTLERSAEVDASLSGAFPTTSSSP